MLCVVACIGGFLKLKCMHMPHTYNVLYRLLSREGNRGEGGGREGISKCMLYSFNG